MMVTQKAGGPPRRRYGKELESALLTAAWDELVQVGYARLTMESIAVRARTSEAVLYRRWPNKDRLVLAALEHYRDLHPVAVPDTGAVRSDLIAYLAAVSKARAGFFAIAAATAFSGLLADTGLSVGQVRDQVMGDHPLPRVRVIYQRAHDRGEINVEAIPSAVLDLPFELVRHDLLLNLKPVGAARLRSIVDELFWPLVLGYQAVPSPAAPPSTGNRPGR